jgi:hypothetical protein
LRLAASPSRRFRLLRTVFVRDVFIFVFVIAFDLVFVFVVLFVLVVLFFVFLDRLALAAAPARTTSTRLPGWALLLLLLLPAARHAHRPLEGLCAVVHTIGEVLDPTAGGRYRGRTGCLHQAATQRFSKLCQFSR